MTGGDNGIAAAQAFTGGQHDASNGVSADMLRNLHDLLFAVQLDGQRFIDFRQLAAVKLDVDNWSEHLCCRLQENGQHAPAFPGGAAGVPLSASVRRRQSL